MQAVGIHTNRLFSVSGEYLSVTYHVCISLFAFLSFFLTKADTTTHTGLPSIKTSVLTGPADDAIISVFPVDESLNSSSKSISMVNFLPFNFAYDIAIYILYCNSESPEIVGLSILNKVVINHPIMMLIWYFHIFSHISLPI